MYDVTTLMNIYKSGFLRVCVCVSMIIAMCACVTIPLHAVCGEGRVAGAVGDYMKR